MAINLYKLINNSNLVKSLKSKKIKISDFAFYTHQEICPEQWTAYSRKMEEIKQVR